MIPAQYPEDANGDMVVLIVEAAAGDLPWVDYIPAAGVATVAASRDSSNADGHTGVKVLSDGTGLTAWIDYIPVVIDDTKTVPWSTDANGFIPLVAYTGSLATGDPQWANTQLIVTYQDNNNDSSGQARGTPTAFIGAIDAYTAFGAAEGMGPSYKWADHGSNDSYFWADASNETSVGAGDFTVEFYHKYGAAGNNIICAKGPAAGEYEWAVTHQLNASYRFWHSTDSGSTFTAINCPDFVTDTADWRYISITRSGSNLYGHIDGVLITTADASGINPTALGNEFQIGYATGLGTVGAKDLSNFRLTIGAARYGTGSYTPPAQPWTQTYYTAD